MLMGKCQVEGNKMTKEKQESSLEQQQPFDNALKSLLEGQEAQILPHILPGAVYQETYSIETVRTILRTDRVYKMLYQGTPHILHLEFQTRSEKDMAARLLEYHAYFYHKYGLPVISIIIYPFRTTMAVSPLEETSNGGVYSGPKSQVQKSAFGKILFLHSNDFLGWEEKRKK
jgi:hypothetical protein